MQPKTAQFLLAVLLVLIVLIVLCSMYCGDSSGLSGSSTSSDQRVEHPLAALEILDNGNDAAQGRGLFDACASN